MGYTIEDLLKFIEAAQAEIARDPSPVNINVKNFYLDRLYDTVKEDLAKDAKIEEESNLYKHAKRELELLGEDDDVIDGYLDMILVFARMGHSGGSASIFIPTLTRLLEFKNLKPLTDDPSEWNHVAEEQWGSPDGIWQNSRNAEAFSNDGGKTYYLLSDGAFETHPIYVSEKTHA